VCNSNSRPLCFVRARLCERPYNPLVPLVLAAPCQPTLPVQFVIRPGNRHPTYPPSALPCPALSPHQAMELLKLMYDCDADFTNTFRCDARRPCLLPTMRLPAVSTGLAAAIVQQQCLALARCL
jgi:hypothetical protein